jgi:hypothetical protein
MLVLVGVAYDLNERKEVIENGKRWKEKRTKQTVIPKKMLSMGWIGQYRRTKKKTGKQTAQTAAMP